jgi:PPOX class probable F420-dependent enzyme
MATALTADIMRLIDARNFAHLATIMRDGSPHSAPVWIGREGNCLIVCTDETSVKARNTARDPRVAISIIDLKDPYSEAQLRGRVVERRLDPTSSCWIKSRGNT